MLPQLREKHRSFFLDLTNSQVSLVWDNIQKKYKEIKYKAVPPTDNVKLFEVCRDFGLDHAGVVFSVANLNGAGREVIEKLIGKPIVPWSQSVKEALKAAAPGKPLQAANGAGATSLPGSVSKPSEGLAAPVTSRETANSRVVTAVKPNPHTPGSQAWLSFAKWRVGDTIQMCKDRGVKTISVRRDIRQGYVTVS